MATQPTPYDRIGGAERLRELVDRFYDLMDSLPEVATLRRMHPEELSGSRDRLFMFLSGWLGGPALFEQRFGHPRLRARHLPFAIDSAARDQWLPCMARALDEFVVDDAFKARLYQAIASLADHMRNRADAPETV